MFFFLFLVHLDHQFQNIRIFPRNYIRSNKNAIIKANREFNGTFNGIIYSIYFLQKFSFTIENVKYRFFGVMYTFWYKITNYWLLSYECAFELQFELLSTTLAQFFIEKFTIFQFLKIWSTNRKQISWDQKGSDFQ